MELGIRYDLRSPRWATPSANLYAAALEQCEWVDANGFEAVRLLEHHGSDDGYCPSPLTLAAAIAARTANMRIRICALILPFHDVVRVAEDVAVVDLISRGRLDLVVGAGYVASEFEMFGVRLEDRVRDVEDGIAALKAAWTGEPFVYRGRPARVALRPFQSPRPKILLGGSSAGAARRAARIADGFWPARGGLYDDYLAECARLGVVPGPRPRPMPKGQFLHVSEDPEATWAELGPHLLHEMSAYAAWLSAAGTGTQYRDVTDIAELRSTGVYSIVTPKECLELARRLGAEGFLEFHPLVAGADPAVGWSCLHLVRDEVVPLLRRDGLMDPA